MVAATGPAHGRPGAAAAGRRRRDDRRARALDRAAFAASIWNPPPALERTAEQAPTRQHPPPLRLQLIGIARDAGPGGDQVLRAALYDPDTDRLHILAEGERVGAVTVIAVEPGVVRLESGGRTAELRLRRDEERAS